MEYLRLSDCSYFSSKRTSKIDYETYISTENMIQNKGGITIAETLPLIKSTSKYEEGDILLSNIRPYFKKIWLANREGGCSNDVLVIKSKDGFDNKFLYYVLSDDNFFNYDTITSKGTKMPRGTPNAIMKYLVPKISLIKQQKIADILSAYDELIENNNRQIEILEAEAEELYKEWFVRFRFPCHETTHFENGLPQGWEYKSIKDFIKFERGVSYSSEEIECENGVNLVNLKNINSYGGFNREGTKKYNGKYRNTQTVQQGDLVLGITDMTQERRTVGSVALIPSMNDVSVISADLLKIVSQIDNSFIYCVCRYGYYSKYFSQFANGANVLHLRQNSLNNKKILLPTASIIELFVNIVNPLFKEIDKVQLQNELLKQQRDLLLPRLMSGKLDVSVKEKTVINDKFNDVREYWQKVKYDENNFGIAARSNGKISEETLQKLKDIAEEDD